MAIISKIRQRSGLLIGVIMIAMISFLVSDALSSRWGVGRSSTDVGEIGGEDVSYNEYEAKVKEMEEQYKAQMGGQELDQATLGMVRDQAWNNLIQEKLFTKEYEKLHIGVSDTELDDLVVGDNPHPMIRQIFTDPKTGQFNKANVINFAKNSDNLEEATRQQWLSVLRQIKLQTVAQKYVNLVKGGIYRTSLEAKQKYIDRNRLINASSVGMNYLTIPDTAVKYTDKDLQAYLDKHTEKYKQEESRDLQFVVFDLAPSSADTAEALGQITEKLEAFRTAEDDSAFVQLQSATPFDPEYKGHGALPQDIEDSLFNAPKGTMVGPLFRNGAFAAYKLTDTKEDSLYSMKASHILVKIDGPTPEDTAKAYEKATKVLAEIKGGKDFAEAAMEYGTDGTAPNGGDLGWFRDDGKMVKEFSDAVKAHNKGDVYLAKTQFGWHIIKNTEEKSKRLVRVAVFSKPVFSSRQTRDNAYSQANGFAVKAQTLGDFDKVIAETKQVPRVANNVKPGDRTIPGLPSARPLVIWAFGEKIKDNDVSDVIEAEDKFVVAVVKHVKHEGQPKLDDVRKELEAQVIKEKKADIFEQQLKDAMAKAKNATDLALTLKTIAEPIENQTFENPNIPYIGNDLKVLGTMFGSKAGQFTQIVRGNNGVYVLWIDKIVEPQDIKDYTQFKMELQSELKSRTDGDLFNAIKENGHVKDNRYRFF